MIRHVKTTGREGAAGTEADPHRRIGEAAYLAQPGDVVTVHPGVYREGVWVNQRNGTAAAPITFKGMPGAIIEPGTGYGGFVITVNHVTVEGFEVRGGDYHGIVAENCHNIAVRNCLCHGNGYSGISGSWGDFYTFENNVCHNNASDGWFSGISIYQARNIAGMAETGEFRNIIRGNVCRDNWTRTGAHTDGNGIIIDDFQHTQTGGFPNYTHRTLVENNLCYANGGKGIQVTWSDNVTVRRNTAHMNNLDTLNDGTWRGEISISQSKGAKVEGNIAVAVRGPGRPANNRAYDNTSTSQAFNSTTFVGNFGWDAFNTPSVRTDGGNVGPGDGVIWRDPALVENVPTATGMGAAGWRPVAQPEPEPEPEPIPEEPTIMEIAALIAALQATLENIETRLAALEARPTDPQTAERIAALESEVSGLKAFDQAVKDLG
jgi:parallel beta-helix repeat protein